MEMSLQDTNWTWIENGSSPKVVSIKEKQTTGKWSSV